MVHFKGNTYKSLDDAVPYGDSPYQTGYMALPAGWRLAPDTNDMREIVIGQLRWGDMVLASGFCIKGTTWGTHYAGSCIDNTCTSNWLLESNGQYKPSDSTTRILLVLL